MFVTTPSTVQTQVTGEPEQSSDSFLLLVAPSHEQVAVPVPLPTVPPQERMLGGEIPGEPPLPGFGGTTPPPLLPPLLGPPFATEKHSVEPSFMPRQQTSPSALEAVKPSGQAQLWTVPPPP